jgi:hypothetical protein
VYCGKHAWLPSKKKTGMEGKVERLAGVFFFWQMLQTSLYVVAESRRAIDHHVCSAETAYIG